MHRLYLSDLDKTLLRSDLTLSDFTVTLWNRLVQEGITLSVATARSHTKTLQLLAPLKLRHPMIVMDGALIVSPQGAPLLSFALERQIGAYLIDLGRAAGIEPFMIGNDAQGRERFRFSSTNALQRELLQAYRNDPRVQYQERLQPLEQNHKVVFIAQEEPLRRLEKQIRNDLGEKVEIKCAKDPYMEGYFLTLLHPKGDKAHALRSLKEMGYADCPVTVFGDSHNDLGMFGCAEEGIAVANAVEELKSLATRILPHTNDQDAVARFLEARFGR